MGYEVPSRLMRCLDDFKGAENEEVVVLSEVLAADVNHGYEDFQCLQLLTFSSCQHLGEAEEVKVWSLQHLRTLCLSAQQQGSTAASSFLRFCFAGDFEVVLDAAQCWEAQPGILGQHGISSEYSE